MTGGAKDTGNCPFSSGSLELFNRFLGIQQSAQLLQELVSQAHWNNGQYTVAGRQFIMPRAQAWYADPGIVYNFTYNLHKHRTWTPTLARLKYQVEEFCEAKFNSVLINWYRNGYDFVDWHSDHEIELGQEPLIASLSLGVNREFCFRHKSIIQADSIELQAGSLLIMHPNFQRFWEHSIARDPQVLTPRLNLTFRKVIMPDHQGG